MTRAYGGIFFYVITALILSVLYLGVWPEISSARNVLSYSDTLSESAPSVGSNHTFSFTALTDIAAGGNLEFTWPADFTVTAPTTTFNHKNVEVYVDDVLRSATTTLSSTTDQVVITSGAGGSIRYNLNTTTGISSGSKIDVLVGNHTSQAVEGFTTATTTGSSTSTTTVPSDIEPIINSDTLGIHRVSFSAGGVAEAMHADFVIFLVLPVAVGPGDTTEIIPPVRFNGAPSSTLSGTTQNVELSVETDELAVCRYSQTPGTAYSSMNNTFSSTGLLLHSGSIVSVANETTYTFYVRCIDDEGNFNTDDYAITFTVSDEPEGEPDPDAEEEGNGEGSGSGSGSGGSGGGSGSGGSSSGGGSGGGRGGDEGNDDSGGGLESSSADFPSGDAEVIISGYAFPGEDVVALVDGGIADTTRAGSDGSFELRVEEIARGVYTFGVYAVDENDVKSTTFSTSFTVTGGKVSELSNINIMPSIQVTPDPVTSGTDVTFSGQSIPNAEITIEHKRDGSNASPKIFTTTSDSSGSWSVTAETDNFSDGTYQLRAKAEQLSGDLLETDFSDYTFYGVGGAINTLNADLNRDGSVNLTDFSILLFWWGSDGGASDPPADINQDTTVSLTDFSILLFQWTG